MEKDLTGFIDASPRKELFIDILTRDISLKSCIFDLIDNAIDSYTKNELGDRRDIKIEISEKEFRIFDDCGGIEIHDLENNVFRFGVKELEREKSTLGIYGIGLKRSLLKLGEYIEIQTNDKKNECLVKWDVGKWKNKKKDGEEDWSIDYEHHASQLKTEDEGFTSIKVSRLLDEIIKNFKLDSYKNKLRDDIHITYTYYMQEHVNIFLNNKKIEPYIIEVRYDDNYKPSKIKEKIDELEVEVTCYIDPHTGRKDYELGKRGWNIFCNHRLILTDDTTLRTGWTGQRGYLPKYHNIYHQFNGIVDIISKDPSKLPLNTFKDGLNIDSSTYQKILNLMIKQARPIINYLNKQYNKEEEKYHEASRNIDNANINTIEKESNNTKNIKLYFDIKVGSEFKAPILDNKLVEPMAKIRYEKPKEIVLAVMKKLQVDSYKKVGEKTFDYYTKMENIKP